MDIQTHFKFLHQAGKNCIHQLLNSSSAKQIGLIYRFRKYCKQSCLFS